MDDDSDDGDLALAIAEAAVGDSAAELISLRSQLSHAADAQEQDRAQLSRAQQTIDLLEASLRSERTLRMRELKEQPLSSATHTSTAITSSSSRLVMPTDKDYGVASHLTTPIQHASHADERRGDRWLTPNREYSRPRSARGSRGPSSTPSADRTPFRGPSLAAAARDGAVTDDDWGPRLQRLAQSLAGSASRSSAIPSASKADTATAADATDLQCSAPGSERPTTAPYRNDSVASSLPPAIPRLNGLIHSLRPLPQGTAETQLRITQQPKHRLQEDYGAVGADSPRYAEQTQTRSAYLSQTPSRNLSQAHPKTLSAANDTRALSQPATTHTTHLRGESALNRSAADNAISHDRSSDDVSHSSAATAAHDYSLLLRNSTNLLEFAQQADSAIAAEKAERVRAEARSRDLAARVAALMAQRDALVAALVHHSHGNSYVEGNTSPSQVYTQQSQVLARSIGITPLSHCNTRQSHSLLNGHTQTAVRSNIATTTTQSLTVPSSSSSTISSSFTAAAAPSFAASSTFVTPLRGISSDYQMDLSAPVAAPLPSSAHAVPAAAAATPVLSSQACSQTMGGGGLVSTSTTSEPVVTGRGRSSAARLTDSSAAQFGVLAAAAVKLSAAVEATGVMNARQNGISYAPSRGVPLRGVLQSGPALPDTAAPASSRAVPSVAPDPRISAVFAPDRRIGAVFAPDRHSGTASVNSTLMSQSSTLLPRSSGSNLKLGSLADDGARLVASSQAPPSRAASTSSAAARRERIASAGALLDRLRGTS